MGRLGVARRLWAAGRRLVVVAGSGGAVVRKGEENAMWVATGSSNRRVRADRVCGIGGKRWWDDIIR